MTAKKDNFKIIVIPPDGPANPGAVIVAGGSGGLGILDLEYVRDDQTALRAVQAVAAEIKGNWGVKLDGYAFASWRPWLENPLQGLDTAIITYSTPASLKAQVKTLSAKGLSVIVEATSLVQAAVAEKAGAKGVIAKGSEAGGRVGEETAFILLQQVLASVSIPVYVQGGIGLHTAAACYAAGTAGVVLDWQTAALAESSFPEEVKSRIVRMDGSEPSLVGQKLGQAYRIYGRPGLPIVRELRQQVLRLQAVEEAADRLAQWRDLVVGLITGERRNELLLLGQDIAIAGRLAEKFRSVAELIAAIYNSIGSHCRTAQRLQPLNEGSGVAGFHRTRYPIVQGPMSRVSDQPSFALKVAEAGGLPVMAVGMMAGDELAPMLKETADLLGDRPWAVGLLSFLPAKIYQEQLELIKRYHPPFAIIAGGVPQHAAVLKDAGVIPYLHVPSSGLLRLYLEEGVKNFIFEGRECGGHIGPYPGFVLWEKAIDTLLEMVPDAEAAEYHVLFAGGIHNAVSAATVASLAAGLAEKGIRVGVMAGTAYLFTRDAVETGALCAGFQKVVLKAKETIVLDSGGGYAVRCIPTDFAVTFEKEKERLQAEGKGPEEVRLALENLNLGRLRIAAKGVAFNPESLKDPNLPMTKRVPESEQKREGLYMAGQVVALHKAVTTVEGLHREICAGGSEILERLSPVREEPGMKEYSASNSNIERGGKESARRRTVGYVDEGDDAANNAICSKECGIAIIGMSCIFPGAKDLQSYWENILNKVYAITEVPPERWDWRIYYDSDPKTKDKFSSRWGGFMEPVRFEPTKYGLPPNSMRSVDPLQLLALEVTGRAIQDAGYSDRPFDKEATSVIFGAGGGLGEFGFLYALRSLLPLFSSTIPESVLEQLPDWTEDSFPGLLPNIVAGRIANRFNFGGVNFTVDAACASSLAALYHGVRELAVGSSSLVIAGGADVLQNPFAYFCFGKTGALSSSGRPRPFDASADGIVISEGVAAVVLKRLKDAERDGDRIYAVIRGMAGSSDGRARGLTAPLPEGQARAFRRAYQQAGISPGRVGLVEAHATGTVLGDQEEAVSIKRLLESGQAPGRSCAVGSVKSMIGHTKCTAGIAGLIKASLALHHKVLPPTLGVEKPQPASCWSEDSPIYLNTETRPWIDGRGKLTAGVSAFGFGGTNFHAVLEEYGGNGSDTPPGLQNWPSELFCWTGNSADEILVAIRPLEQALEKGPAVNLRDLALTVDKDLFNRKAGSATAHLAIVAESAPDLKEKLSLARQGLEKDPEFLKNPNGIYYSRKSLAAEGKIVFLFPGQGSQRPGMFSELAIVFSEPRRSFSMADKVLSGRLPKSLSEYVFPAPAFTAEEKKKQLEELTRTNIAQPALGAAGMGLFNLLKSLGVNAGMTAGHSSGEYTSLAAAGVFSEEILYDLLEYRGASIIAAGDRDLGMMAAVAATPDRIKGSIVDLPDVYLSSLNSPKQTVLSGSRTGLKEALARLQARGITARQIPVGAAFHSPFMQQARDHLARKLAETKFSRPAFSVYSNSLAGLYPSNEKKIVACLSDHLVNPVRFTEEVEAMYKDGGRIFVEVGPRNVLTNLTGQILEGKRFAAVACNSGSQRPEITQFLQCLGQLLAEGVSVKLERLFQGRKARSLEIEKIGSGDEADPAGPTTWMVAGDAAWPASETKPVRRQVSWGKETAGVGGVMPDAGSPADSRSTAEAAEAVIQYQKVMAEFLRQQRQVMTAFLGGEVVGGPGTTVPKAEMPQVRTAAPGPPQSAGPAVTVRSSSEVKPEVRKVIEERQAGVIVGAAPTAQELEKMLLDLTSARTGYPVQMLGLDLDIEADLGIDSIKRVEILTAFRKGFPGTPADLGERMSGAKTLRKVLKNVGEALAAGQAGKADFVSPESGLRPPKAEVVEEKKTSAVADNVRAGFIRPEIGGDSTPTESVSRLLISLKQEAIGSDDSVPVPDGAVIITDDQGGAAESFRKKIRELGGKAVIVRLPGKNEPAGQDVFYADLTKAGSVETFIQEVRRKYERIAGIVHLLPLRQPAGLEEMSGKEWQESLNQEVKSLFYLLHYAAPDLNHGRKWVLAALNMGGDCKSGTLPCPRWPWRGGVMGLVKTAALEWPQAVCKAIDTDAFYGSAVAAQLLAEVAFAGKESEIYRRGEDRWVTGLQPVPLEVKSQPPVKPGKEDVILVTGGSRGITAQVVEELAVRYQCRFVIVGRSPWPAAEEPPETAKLQSGQELKKDIFEAYQRVGRTPAPKDVESAYARIMADREMRLTKGALEKAGAGFDYYQADVRNQESLAVLIDKIYRDYGRLDGVICGAGIIEDKLLADKTPDSFERVFGTKTEAAFVFSRKLRSESLKFLVFFSSIAGAFGNPGQADYVAANEILNRMAAYLDNLWPGRVVAVNWGPWDKKGMVNDALRWQFAERGIRLISPVAGRKALAEEISSGEHGQPIVVLK